MTLSDQLQYVGFNGRCNKIADTCYCWWVGGTLSVFPPNPLCLAPGFDPWPQFHCFPLPLPLTTNEKQILGQANLVNKPASRRFLLSKTQHLVGGFSKHVGYPPDIYHAYLGLAALATMGEPCLKPFDTMLCVSEDTVKKVQIARRSLLS